MLWKNLTSAYIRFNLQVTDILHGAVHALPITPLQPACFSLFLDLRSIFAATCCVSFSHVSSSPLPLLLMYNTVVRTEMISCKSDFIMPGALIGFKVKVTTFTRPWPSGPQGIGRDHSHEMLQYFFQEKAEIKFHKNSRCWVVFGWAVNYQFQITFYGEIIHVATYSLTHNS